MNINIKLTHSQTLINGKTIFGGSDYVTDKGTMVKRSTFAGRPA